MRGNSNSTLVVSQNQPFSDSLYSYELTIVFQWFQFTVLNQLVCLFGVGSNIINIICFIKQGFKDPVNVSFLGLAMADLGCLVPVLWTNLCINPAFIAADLPFEPMDIVYITGGIPHTAFTRVSSWITALITLERCLCIIIPLKVRSIVTSKRVSIIIGCVLIIILLNTAPIYAVNELGWKFYPHRNKTLISMVSTENRETVEQIYYIVNSVCIPLGAFAVIIISTIILVIQLKKKSKWRKASTCSTQGCNTSARNQKVAKMVVMISVLFISCFTPLCLVFFAMSLEPELSITGKYRSTFFILGGFAVLLEFINSSSNIFIYYHMSSKYRAAIRQLFCLSTKV